MEDAFAAWENEGGSSARTEEHRMIGTINQIAWAVQIKAQVDAEFDRAYGKCLSLWPPNSPRTMEQTFRPSFESSKTNARK
jgi:hypothetical protein